MGDIPGPRYLCLYGVPEPKDDDEDDWLRLPLKATSPEAEEGSHPPRLSWVRGDAFSSAAIRAESASMIVRSSEVNTLPCLSSRKLDKARAHWLLEALAMAERVGVMNDAGSGRRDGREREDGVAGSGFAVAEMVEFWPVAAPRTPDEGTRGAGSARLE